MAKRTDTGDGRGMATLDVNDPPELPASTAGSSTSGASASPSSQGAGASRRSQGQGQQNPDQNTVQQAKEQVKNLAGEAKDQTRKVAEQARDQVQEVVERRKDEAAERLGSVAEALREAGRKLQEGEQGGDFGRYAERAAAQVDRLSSYLRDHDLRAFVRDTEEFARRRPEIVLGGTFLAGLMLARFLKSSAPERGGRGMYSAGYRASTYPNRSSYTPGQPRPGESSYASGGTTAYNAPIGV